MQRSLSHAASISLILLGVGGAGCTDAATDQGGSEAAAQGPASGLQADPKAPQREEPAKPAGRWHKRRVSKDDGSSAKTDLSGLGYSAAYGEAGELKGAFAHMPDAMAPGLTLFCSGHDTSVLLVDAQGDVRHHWHLDYGDLFGESLPFEVPEEHKQFVRRAYPYPNGDLLVIFEYIGIARVDAGGNPIWVHAGRNHHDFELQPDGSIVTLGMTQSGAQAVKSRYKTARFSGGVADNQVVFLDASGEPTRSISIFDAFHGSDHAPFLGDVPNNTGDIFHANSVDLVDGVAAAAHPQLEVGDVLVSMRNPSAVIAIDGETELVKWLATGIWRQQHQATALPNGKILLLDNCGGNSGAPMQWNQSRILELDPVTQAISWRYPAKGSKDDFFTHYLGYVERLPGGNTLVTESTQGHLIELDPRGQVVWEYFSPFRAGDDGELITTLMGARRIATEELPFLDQ